MQGIVEAEAADRADVGGGERGEELSDVEDGGGDGVGAEDGAGD